MENRNDPDAFARYLIPFFMLDSFFSGNFERETDGAVIGSMMCHADEIAHLHVVVFTSDDEAWSRSRNGMFWVDFAVRLAFKDPPQGASDLVLAFNQADAVIDYGWDGGSITHRIEPGPLGEVMDRVKALLKEDLVFTDADDDDDDDDCGKPDREPDAPSGVPTREPELIEAG